MMPRRLPAQVLGLAVLAFACVVLAGCGASATKSVEEGQPVSLGDLKYNVLFSRFLNAHDVEDSSYLKGQPPAKPNQLYLGVFLLIKNNGDRPASLPYRMLVTDTAPSVFRALPTSSEYALKLGSTVLPDAKVPDPDTVPAVGPIQGSLVLFRVPDSVTESRPLTLLIPGPGGPARVELDI